MATHTAPADEPFVDPDELRRANAAYDSAHPGHLEPGARVKCAWRELVVRGQLTDRKIETYAEAGFYSPEFRQFRREQMQKKKNRPGQRNGNFSTVEGRLIYRPD